MNDGTEARVSELPMCDFCKDEFKARPASYDARTAYGWANMCDDHMAEHGPSKLGLGIGQRFVLVDTQAKEHAAEMFFEKVLTPEASFKAMMDATYPPESL